MWIVHIDGVSSKHEFEVKIKLISPTREVLEHSFQLAFNTSNNKPQYETRLAERRLALIIGPKELSAFIDSQMVTSEFHDEYEAKNEQMEAYLKKKSPMS